jgi:hypothetical protein
MAVIALLLGLLAVFGIHSLATEPGKRRRESNCPHYRRWLNSTSSGWRSVRNPTPSSRTKLEAEVGAGLRGIQEERRKSWQQVDRWWEALLKIPRSSERGRALQQQLDGQYKAWRAAYVELDDLIERLAAVTDPHRR